MARDEIEQHKWSDINLALHELHGRSVEMVGIIGAGFGCAEEAAVVMIETYHNGSRVIPKGGRGGEREADRQRRGENGYIKHVMVNVDARTR